MSNTAQAPIRSRTTRRSVANTVNLIMVVDTDVIKSTYGPNSGLNDARGLDHHEGINLLCPKANYKGQANGQNDPANIIFSANVQDYVAFWGTTISNNSDDAVIIYDISPNSGNPNVFNPFRSDEETLSGAIVPSQPNPVPGTNTSVSFYSFESKVKNKGTEAFTISFALYEVDPNNPENQVLYGCYFWDPTIEVK
ncbi:AidA/PixA family protein [Chitinophaga silvisoli]|uniref:DNA-directed RNA polymerase subunit beta n=1 Tax=Chitinophaga silvisoli TaxID=2291814 RepID=A0A3E1NSP1_9BACT|nr:AidA/PixA family protein [Chitinophaga silvisoli]RFM30937.1 DNA-directed RNA polymerase subunit beta [Chitinophaga silvisoli]